MTVGDALAGVTRLGVDSAAFIYLVEANPGYLDVCEEAFRHVSSGAISMFTSSLTLTETLVHPIRNSDTALEGDYVSLLTGTNGIHSIPVDTAIARRGAALRARYGLRTPDALQIATALEASCEAFLTNDSRLRRVTDLRVLILDELTI